MNKPVFTGVGLGVSAFVFYASTFTLNETEQAVITRFGEPVGEAVETAGLHFKLPFADRVNRFEKRSLEWSGEPNQIPTRDKKYIWVDTFARWRIADPLLFFQRMRDERTAASRIDDIIDGRTRDTIAGVDLIEVVRASDRTFDDEELGLVQGEAFKVEAGRNVLSRRILQSSAQVLSGLGVELIDVQIKRVNYVESVQAKVYERMISERRRIAEQFRSEGNGRAAEIRGEMQKMLKEIESNAFKRSEEIRGNADAEASRIYASAYGKNPEFYQFMRSLDSYRQTVNHQTTLFLGVDSEFYRYMVDGKVAAR